MSGNEAFWAMELGIVVREELAPGGCWHKKDGTAVDQSFSLSLLQVSGGIARLLTEWVPEKGSPLSKKWGLG
jgi:hypothetical protein